MSYVEKIMSDIIQTTSDLFSPTCNVLKNKLLLLFGNIRSIYTASAVYALMHKKTTAVSQIEGLPWLWCVINTVSAGRDYQMCARLSAGTKSLSPSFMPNAEYHASIIGSAAFTRRLLGECTSLFTM
mgnify:CR=1 FL=1